MTPADLSRVVCEDIEDRLRDALIDLRHYCERRGEPLSDAQMFAVMSLPLRLLIGLEESVETMVGTYDAIRRVMPDLPDWPDTVDAWLREQPTEHIH